MSHSTASAAPPLRMGVPIPNGKLGMWLFLGTEIMFFTAFIGTYIVLRMGSPGWPTDTAVTHINVYAGGINTFILICSSVSIVFAHAAMTNRDYQKVIKCMAITFAFSCVFLGIKSYEYWGKISHDILPGHIAESPQQAFDKMVRELDRASGIPALKAKQNAIGIELVQEPQNAESLGKEAAAIKTELEGQSKVDKAYGDLRAKLRANTLSLEQAHHELETLQKEFPQFNSVHAPHVILYGNIFASTYFTMTGFHALHVVLGMGMFLGVIWMGMKKTLGPQHETLVENFGLYWHFVDLVWIFLFPLIYII